MALPFKPDPSVETLQQRNKAFAESLEPIPLLSEMELPHTLIISCMDPRADPIDYWSLKRGEALVYRNPGGRIANDAKTLWFLDSLMAPIRNLYIVHHTDCGASHSKVDRIAAFTMQHNPTVTEEDLKGIDFGTFTDLEQSVRDDLQFLHDSPLVRKGLAEVARGFVFDLKTGLVTEVKA